ncbi:erythromycin esterase family protein [Streptomyces sp. NPDC059850]|uniref:erythromycin esterase family protein n=1 Tax=Streptomyces sp. NPDC059850 TaxID=3346970 RepID=UPI0036614222
MMKYRDQAMAENVAWRHRYTGDRILLSAHNTHVSYDSFDVRYPKTQGAFLRDALGKDYVSDMRTAPDSARTWLATSRVTWNIGAGWPDPTEYRAALGTAHDILIHLHDVEATTYLGNP